MSRSSGKLNYLPKAVSKQLKKKKSLNIWTRDALIPSFLLNRLVKIYNGKEYKTIKITQEKIGFKFGEFSNTRKPYIYKGKKKIIGKKK
jgi:small subunit ribosomal protein S19